MRDRGGTQHGHQAENGGPPWQDPKRPLTGALCAPGPRGFIGRPTASCLPSPLFSLWVAQTLAFPVTPGKWQPSPGKSSGEDPNISKHKASPA